MTHSLSDNRPTGADMQPEAITVRYREHAFEAMPATRVGTVVFRDECDEQLDAPQLRRFFWLLDHGIQMVYAPCRWPGEWRIDLVTARLVQEPSGTTLFVRDMALDIVVEAMGPTYRMLDLDDLGERLITGEYTAAEVADVLARAQRFLDAFLHRGAPWPPPPIASFFSPTHDYPIVGVEANR